ncbi:hypothetical protein AB0E67_27210 [Streptomyces sp. NPDC032161]|uniref:hypothetical protein n=1 Tax=unclassified Streptomyces TaxID=2593676 RepID=UPI0033E2DD07
MGTPTFQIVTTDNEIYTQGRPETGRIFASLDGDEPLLDSYEHDGDFLVLRYESGFLQLLPEHRIKHIACLDQD